MSTPGNGSLPAVPAAVTSMMPLPSLQPTVATNRPGPMAPGHVGHGRARTVRPHVECMAVVYHLGRGRGAGAARAAQSRQDRRATAGEGGGGREWRQRGWLPIKGEGPLHRTGPRTSQQALLSQHNTLQAQQAGAGAGAHSIPPPSLPPSLSTCSLWLPLTSPPPPQVAAAKRDALGLHKKPNLPPATPIRLYYLGSGRCRRGWAVRRGWGGVEWGFK